MGTGGYFSPPVVLAAWLLGICRHPALVVLGSESLCRDPLVSVRTFRLAVGLHPSIILRYMTMSGREFCRAFVVRREFVVCAFSEIFGWVHLGQIGFVWLECFEIASLLIAMVVLEVFGALQVLEVAWVAEVQPLAELEEEAAVPVV